MAAVSRPESAYRPNPAAGKPGCTDFARKLHGVARLGKPSRPGRIPASGP